MQQTGTSLLVLVVLVLRGCSATNFANAYLDSLLSSANDRTYVTNAEQQMEETVHGISATTEELNEKAQSIISIANIFNVKSIDDVPLDDKPNGIVDDLRKRESELCVNVACTENKYRPIDGICNNINHPLYGASKTAQARLVAPEWEKTTVIAFQLNNPEEEVAVDPYGVNPTEVPILFHLHGNAIFELLLLNSEPTSETVECKEGAKCLVNGIIIDVEEGNEEQDCTEGVNMGFTGNGMFVKGTCEGSFLVNYLPYAARIVLDPNGKETKILTPSNGEATPQTSEGILFPDLDSDPQLFWIDNRGRSLKVGKGSECDERTILMETKVTDKILTDKHRVRRRGSS